MPMKTKEYPPDWPEIAMREKRRAHWICEDCGADCWNPVSQVNRMSVHHLDHNPANCDPANLIALCSGCHLRLDAQHHAKNAAITRTARRAGPTLALPI